MTSDLDERAWWVFQTPSSVAYVPALTEQRARSVMAANAYPNAPVDAWPLVGTRVTSREALTRDLLTKGNNP